VTTFTLAGLFDTLPPPFCASAQEINRDDVDDDDANRNFDSELCSTLDMRASCVVVHSNRASIGDSCRCHLLIFLGLIGPARVPHFFFCFGSLSAPWIKLESLSET